ncbi:PucR family transcriptional regulator [Labedaea rhizosphaerae]|uniref:PucR-like helix-turn-helix protein n=1 Tax=Labedaea rhizosphaerae TaxID=598644 RepID=A0A4V3D0K1_LABRH|nr:PucR family transcriptional regulator [Labedaea rhizosphaerae]TDQ05805.1 PucR-like helix-turn-helix protein [Labedaea rhizosphaerae]
MAHKELAFGGKLLRDLLTSGAVELAHAVVDRLAANLPVYRALPAEELSGDIVTVAKRCIRQFADVLHDGALPEPGDLAELRESAARRAEEGVPLDAVLSAYHLGIRVCLDLVVPHAEPADLPAVIETQRLTLEYLRLVAAAVSAGYFDVRGEEQEARQSLFSVLLDGGDAEQVATRSGLRLPAGYLVLGLGVGVHPDERREGIDRSVAARRKVRRLRNALERATPERVLATLSPDGGIALLATKTATEPTPQEWTALGELVARLAKAAGTDVLAAAVPARPAGVQEAATLAGELRAVAYAFGMRSGLYRLDDLTVEYQLTRPGPARDRLAAQLDPVRDKPELLGTLRAYVSSGLNRRATATGLHVHPNTVDYRLRKVAALTGLDTTRPAEVLRVRAALAALDATVHGVG